jgi:hypothetical protein
MENDLFHWNSFDLILEEITEKENNNQNKFKNSEDKDVNITNEKLMKNKNTLNKNKFTFDIGASFITINNSVFCFNKNNIQGQSNSYLKVDKIKKLNFKEKYFTVKNIYSKLNGPRYRVTNVII